MTTPTITILAFARARDALGFAEKSVPFEPGQTADDALKSLCPDWRARLANCRLALDLEFVDSSTTLRPGQVLALIPPVSGG